MTPTAEYIEHRYPGADPADAHKYLAPVLRRLVAGESHTRLLDLGCGNGSLIAALMPEGCDVHAVDLSSTGIQNAKEAFPKVRFHCLDVTGRLDAIPGFGSFDVVTSAEVVEHLYLPRHLARNSYQALRPGGVAIFTNPLPRVLEKRRNGLDRETGCSLYRPLGRRPHQVLEPPDSHPPPRRGRVPSRTLRRRRKGSTPLEKHDPCRAQARPAPGQRESRIVKPPSTGREPK